jgi:hypothetical protein
LDFAFAVMAVVPAVLVFAIAQHCWHQDCGLQLTKPQMVCVMF